MFYDGNCGTIAGLHPCGRPKRAAAGISVAIPATRNNSRSKRRQVSQATERSTANEIDLRNFAPTERHTRMIVSQSDDVETDVLNALYWDLAVPPHRLKVEVENGWVTMSGMVDRPYQIACAESDVRRVPGVVGVNNQIRLAPAQVEQVGRTHPPPAHPGDRNRELPLLERLGNGRQADERETRNLTAT